MGKSESSRLKRLGKCPGLRYAVCLDLEPF